MAPNSYAQAIGDKIRKSGAIVPIGSTVLLMIAVSLILWLMDNYSSYIAVLEMSVRTERADQGWFGDILISLSYIAKAFIPQGTATIMFSVFLLMKDETQQEKIYKWGSLAIGCLAWAYDGWTGYMFYIHPITEPFSIWTHWATDLNVYYRDALLNAVVYDTIGSEFLLSLTVGIFSVIAEDYVEQMRKLRKALAGTGFTLKRPTPPGRPAPVPNRPGSGHRPAPGGGGGGMRPRPANLTGDRPTPPDINNINPNDW